MTELDSGGFAAGAVGAGDQRGSLAGPVFSPEFGTYMDAAGRSFEYARVRHPDAKALVVHFSAFFGRWGEARRYRQNFSGYFHRLRMLGSCDGYDWLFVCDAYGAFRNGCYYSGERGDPFVERAMLELVERERREAGFGNDQLVTVGSSMGGTGALVLGLLADAAGVVAIGPHVDLELAATRCGRFDEVAFACPDGDPTSDESRGITRRVFDLVENRPPDRPLPGLFVQVCQDDAGVYSEQVLPLVARWHARGGAADLDARPTGGHTSEYATRELLVDAIDNVLAGRSNDVVAFQTDDRYAVHLRPDSPYVRLRRRLALRRRLRALASLLGCRP